MPFEAKHVTLEPNVQATFAHLFGESAVMQCIMKWLEAQQKLRL
jgi:hypothetical protein